MKFNTKEDARNAIAEYVPVNGKRKFSIAIKIAVVEFLKTHPHSDIGTNLLCPSLSQKWKRQYREGLFNLNAATAVSIKAKQDTESAIAVIDGKIAKLQEQKALILQCESMGFTVTANINKG